MVFENYELWGIARINAADHLEDEVSKNALCKSDNPRTIKYGNVDKSWI